VFFPRCVSERKSFYKNPISRAVGCVGGHLPFEDGVKNCKLFEPQASSCSLAIKNEQVAKQTGASSFVTLRARKVSPAAATKPRSEKRKAHRKMGFNMIKSEAFKTQHFVAFSETESHPEYSSYP